MGVLSKFKGNIKYLLCLTIFSVLFFWWFSKAQDDLLWQLIEPAYRYWETIITIWESVNEVWQAVIEWPTIEVTTSGLKSWTSIIVKVTRILLSLIIALSVTMILYNGMMYIIQTWQWKDAKDLTKNIAYIVVWILVALFSVVIITLIQSVPKTLDDELNWWRNVTQDSSVVEWKAKSFKEFFMRSSE